MPAEWMKTAKVGDPIVCTSEFPRGGTEKTPQPGKIYRIRSIIPVEDMIAVRLAEIVNVPRTYALPWGCEYIEVWFDLTGFKPPKTSTLDTAPADLPDANVGFCGRQETTEPTL